MDQHAIIVYLIVIHVQIQPIVEIAIVDIKGYDIMMDVYLIVIMS